MPSPSLLERRGAPARRAHKGLLSSESTTGIKTTTPLRKRNVPLKIAMRVSARVKVLLFLPFGIQHPNLQIMRLHPLRIPPPTLPLPALKYVRMHVHVKRRWIRRRC
jgi:hypothetical protein